MWQTANPTCAPWNKGVRMLSSFSSSASRISAAFRGRNQSSQAFVIVDSGSRVEQGLDGPSFVHCSVALGGFLQWKGEVEDLPRLDRAIGDQLDVLGEESP